MSSLIGSSRTTENHTMQARTSAAIRQTAPQKASDGGAAGRLAGQALIDPASLVPHFLARIAVNPAVSASACSDCGYSLEGDDAILYVVSESWAEVAATVYPDAEPEPTA